MIKLGDFGLAEQMEHSCSKRRNQREVLWYDAPEVFEDETGLKSDVWSLGISMIELAEGKNPFDGFTAAMVMKAVCVGSIPSLSSSEWSAEFVDFVKKCLVRDANERASVGELMSVSPCGWV